MLSVVVVVVVAIYLYVGSKTSNQSPFRAVLISNDAGYLEANREALQLARDGLAKFGNHESLTVGDKVDLTHAIRLYKGMLEYKPASAIPNLTIGMAYQALGFPDQAISTLKDFITGTQTSKNPDVIQARSDAHWITSKCYFDEHNYSESAKQSTEAIKLNKNVARYYSQRASAELQLKQISLAINDATKASQLDPNDPQAHGILSLLKR